MPSPTSFAEASVVGRSLYRRVIRFSKILADPECRENVLNEVRSEYRNPAIKPDIKLHDVNFLLVKGASRLSFLRSTMPRIPGLGGETGRFVVNSDGEVVSGTAASQSVAGFKDMRNTPEPADTHHRPLPPPHLLEREQKEYPTRHSSTWCPAGMKDRVVSFSSNNLRKNGRAAWRGRVWNLGGGR
eukprot:TRINITY_DN3176_c0_g1_i2.p2 TRINITY_DN3176_c0_g1~~TRINITY_DN3176_c0_g1_i2.p2  ORF type:complete len:186 (+),score=4.23 TRINITY_DN3176_c0_g1_i2:211-768(+)